MFYGTVLKRAAQVYPVNSWLRILVISNQLLWRLDKVIGFRKPVGSAQEAD